MVNKFTVYVHGGLVQKISGIPEDAVVEVVDFDVIHGDEKDLTMVNGKWAFVSEWKPDIKQEE